MKDPFMISVDRYPSDFSITSIRPQNLFYFFFIKARTMYLVL